MVFFWAIASLLSITLSVDNNLIHKKIIQNHRKLPYWYNLSEFICKDKEKNK